MHRAALSGAVWLVAALAWAGPSPDWKLPEFPRRAVLMRLANSSNDAVVVTLPAEGVKAGGAFAVHAGDGTIRPHRVLSEDADRVALLIGVDREADPSPCTVYYGAPAGTPGGAADAGLRDARPVLIEVYRARGRGIPTSWARFLYMLNAAGRAAAAYYETRFDAADLPEYRWQPGNHQHRDAQAIVREQSFLLCPTTGVYRLALNCENAGFVRVDNNLVMEQPGEHAAGTWQRSRPVLLSAGPHRLEVFNYTDRDGALRVGWCRDADDSVVPIPDLLLVAAQEVSDFRVERSDRTVHAAFRYTLRPAYAFRGLDPVFVPVQFRSTSTDWLSPSMTCRWRFDGGDPSEGTEKLQVLEGLAQHRVSLEVRDALGFVSCCERIVDCSRVDPTRYAVAAEVVGLPAAAYAEDRLEPVLRVRGEAAPPYPFAVTWSVQQHSVQTRHTSDALTLTERNLSIPLAGATADSLTRIDWQLSHEGIAIQTGSIRFLKAPFESTPVRAEGDRLYDARGAQLVLVSRRGGGDFQQPAISTEQAFGTVWCADDCLASPGVRGAEVTSDFCVLLERFVDGPGRPVVRHLPLPPWEDAPQAFGPLLKLLQIPQGIDAKADVVILSVGRQDMFQHVDGESFERNIAVLSDLLSMTLKRPVVWVTPPPYPADAGLVRPYAAAIRRVAAARGIPVADVFSAFSGHDHPEELFAGSGDPVLTQSAQYLAGQVIARALLAE